ncbi:MAG: DUF4258 domain-containing protein [Chloroflexi bacterium]|nr:DUF4258 domain-containing protein [Chloroflexota bacterium]
MKSVDFSPHALERMPSRGTNQQEVEAVIRTGEMIPAKQGRIAFRKNLPFESKWKNRYYETKQVVAVVKEETERFVVVTVFVFYFGGNHENKL